MFPDQTCHLRPSRPFTAHYPLTVADSFMVQMDSIYLYIFSTAESLPTIEKSHLTNVLTKSLSTLFQQPEPSPCNLPELLGTLYEDPESGNIIAKVTPASSVPFVVKDRSSDVRFSDLRPDLAFPLRHLEPSIFGPGLTVPPPDASKGVQPLWIQLTFIDGGFVIHSHIHHWITGADGAARLVEGWLERARLLSATSNLNDAPDLDLEDIIPKCKIQFGGRQQLSDTLASVTVPQLDHPDLRHVPGGRRVWAGLNLPPIVLSILVSMFTFLTTYLPCLLPRSDVQIFHFSPEALRRLRDDVRGETNGDEQSPRNELTANDCLTAFLWQLITRARFGLNPSGSEIEKDKVSTSTSTILTAVDFKSRLQPQLHPNFFGNASLDLYTDLPISTLIANSETSETASASRSRTLSSLGFVAEQIHQSIKSITDAYIRSMYQLITSRPRILDTQKRPINFQYGTDVLCTSWEHIHKDSSLLQIQLPDNRTKNRIVFEAFRYMHSEGVDGVIVTLPAFGSKWKECDEPTRGKRRGGLEVVISLRRKSMKRLMEDEELRRYAVWGEAGGYKVSV